MMQTVCDNCGKLKKTFPCRIRTHKHFFCNKKCYGEWCSKNDSLIHSKNWHSKGGYATYKLHPEIIKKAMEKSKEKRNIMRTLLPIKEIIKFYKEGKSSQEIAKIYNIKSYSIIIKILRENNIKIRNRKEFFNLPSVKNKILISKKKYIKEHPEYREKMRENGKKSWHTNFQKSGLTKEGYQRSLANKCLKKYGKEHYIRMAKLGGPASAKANREKKPYEFMGCKFDSKQEMKVTKIFNEKLGFVPKERINCHIKVDGIEFDFLLNDIFIEWHPWDRRLNFEEYYDKRKKILEKNKLNNGLIVFDKLNNIESFCEVIKNSNNLSTLLLFDK